MTDIFSTLITMADIGMSVKEVMMTFVTSKRTQIKRHRSHNGSCTPKMLLGVGRIRDKI